MLWLPFAVGPFHISAADIFRRSVPIITSLLAETLTDETFLAFREVYELMSPRTPKLSSICRDQRKQNVVVSMDYISRVP
jgi:hypothetical protein